jgi:hypothetical protein
MEANGGVGDGHSFAPPGLLASIGAIRVFRRIFVDRAAGWMVNIRAWKKLVWFLPKPFVVVSLRSGQMRLTSLRAGRFPNLFPTAPYGQPFRLFNLIHFGRRKKEFKMEKI